MKRKSISSLFRQTLAAMGFCAALASVSCSKPADISSGSPTGRIPVTVSVEKSLFTKVKDTSGEEKITSLQVMAFRPSGELDAYLRMKNAGSMISCTGGERQFVAVANAPDMSGVRTLAEFMALKSDLLDNAPSSLVMADKVSKVIRYGYNEVFMKMKRLVANIRLGKIQNCLSAPAYADVPILVKSVFVSNAVGESVYFPSAAPLPEEETELPPAPLVWYNMSGELDPEAAPLTQETLSETVAHGQEYVAGLNFYTYSNRTVRDSESSVWTPRFTRLVIETEILGKTYYYPVSIEDVLPNCVYNIASLKIYSLGSESPDKAVDPASVKILVSVAPWDKTFVSNVAI